MKIGVVDYNAGNLKSVETALSFLGANFVVSGDPGELAGTDKIIFPGVGEASSAMKVLSLRGLDDFLIYSMKKDVPILGICLGSQIVLDFSDENSTVCLGLVPGKAKLFQKKTGYKIPHMGWNQAAIKREHYIFKGINQGTSFYFVHSYYPKLENMENEIASTDYSVTFTSAFSRGSLVALQFHPEKSGEAGLLMLNNFIKA